MSKTQRKATTMSDHNPAHFTSGPGATERAQKGQARMREFAREQAEAIRVNSAIMLEGLTQQTGRAPSQLEVFQAESISSMYWQAAHARASGKFKAEVELLMKAAALARDSVFAYTIDHSLQRRPAVEQSSADAR
jgi:hypothetical protein